MDDAEQQMRKALGLHGEGPRSRPEGEPQQRAGGGFMQGVHRRRFVQDGEVPVTVVRRDPPDNGNAHGGMGQSGPTSSRLQRVEAALASETAGRERAERALHEAQSALQALQTKIGHNDLAKNEAVAASKRLGEEVVTLREQVAAGAEIQQAAEARAHDSEEELRALRVELAEERRGRKLAERLLREATDDSAVADTYAAGPAHRPADPIERVAPRRGRPPTVHAEPDVEQEPVKWWLLPAKTVAKRR
jgi:hypothetical protein